MNPKRFCGQCLTFALALLMMALVLDSVPHKAWAQTPPGLVLWNKLGSDYEVQHSEFGENGIVVGSQYAYEPAKHGYGYVRKSGQEDYIAFPASVLDPLHYRGAIEVWVTPKVPCPIEYQYGDWGLIGGPPYGNTGAPMYHNVWLIWGDWSNPDPGFRGGIDFGGQRVETNPEATQYEATPFAPFHAAICWDIDGIPDSGGDTIQVYRDGVVVSSSMELWDPSGTDRHDLILGIVADNASDKFIVDNIKIWDYAKTDYSDRFMESFPTETMGWVEGQVTDATNGDPVVAYVGVQGQPGGTSTDANGNYRLYLEPALYTLEASAIGYLGGAAEVEILAGEPTLKDLQLEPVPRPANDDVGHAEEIDIPQAEFLFEGTLDTTNATMEGNEPCEGRNSVWYKMAPTVNSCVTVDLAGTDYCTVLSVFRGSPGQLEWVGGCNWTCEWDGDRTLGFTAEVGQSYYILVSASNGDGGNLVLTVDGAGPPANDSVADALVIPALDYHGALDTLCATWDEPTPAGSCWGWARNVWYKLTLPANRFVRVSTEGSSYWAPIEVYIGSPGALSRITCNSPVVEFRAPEGQPCYIMISGQGGNLVLDVQDLGPALDIEALVKGGTVNSKTGAATINGVVQCNKPVLVRLNGELRQRLGRGTIISAGFDKEFACSPGEATPWSVVVRGERPYGGGSAELLANAWGCSQEPQGDCDEDRIEQVIKMKGGK